MTDRQRNGFILLLVLGLVAGSIAVMATMKTRLGLDLKGGVELVYQGEPTAATPKVTPDALSRAVDIMRERIDQLGVAEPQIQTSGENTITAALPDVKDIARAERLIGSTAQLAFYDWEANLIEPPNGGSVVQGLQVQDSTATILSQGVAGQISPGDPGAGGVSLYQAVSLAAKQPYSASNNNLRVQPQFYLFGAPGSAACATAARDQGKTPQLGQHCLLSGPDENQQDLRSGLPTGVSISQGQLLEVQRGTIVLQAANPSASQKVNFNDPNAQFYVLRDHFSLVGNDINNPQQSTDEAGNPDVTFGLSSHGAKAFQAVTAAIAHRGDRVSFGAKVYNQHFAVALDNQLISVPEIDFKKYPDGIIGGSAEITGGFTIQSAQDLATQLRLGALPINLKPISESQVSATLGKQALHQGLIAGIAGLLVVVAFLLAFYRVLGVIATAGLVVYGIYFYALIKLIPITLTLPGIAGLILTIGVAADANIVIFERVKEEIRGGRSIRQGIVTGYKKGLTAIIDANVVTIMTAFILFVLATADVKGFAFTLGIGTFVSLFTAVMATQAILATMGNSRLISRPSALGAGGERRVWRFDFMGASRYFFSMSGVILLVGALAIGGRGLHLGIDFTSGTRFTVGLQKPADESQVRALLAADGVSDATVQRISGDKTLGPYAFQVSASSKSLSQAHVARVRTDLDTKYNIRHNGNDFNSQFVGPTFGKTVANSAVIAIIASLLVISLYVALRFEWKFAVPVLIALMHDLLITSGVYALTGREVTTATVAALLTILGYSLYDTIIVFDRVRENVPRMPRAAFSQIVNRSMSEVLTRSVATTSCTLIPIIALLLFGGSTLQDFAFALLIGVASGAYSSIFIASPVLTHWKERESLYRHRRERIEAEHGGLVPAYASLAGDVDPTPRRPRRAGRLTTPAPEGVSAAEFEQMKRELGIEEEERRAGRTSTLTRRLAHTEPEPASPPAPARRPRAQKPPGAPKPQAGNGGGSRPGDGTARGPGDGPARGPGDGAGSGPGDSAGKEAQRPVTPAPDIAENEGMLPPERPKRPPKSRAARNRRHGRPR